MRGRRIFRKISLLLATALLICGNSTAALAADYEDVSESAWYHSAVDYVTEQDLMVGTGSSFQPETPMTRAMLVTVLHRIDNTPTVSGNGDFSEVPDSSYYTTAVAWASANRIVSGVGEGKFAPQSPISREQLATILYRYADVKGYDTSAYAEFDGFSDASQVSSYAQNAMHWAVANQIIQGSEGKLTPSKSATRAQVAAMIMRFKETDMIEKPAEPVASAEPTAPVRPVEDITMNITIDNRTFTAKMYDNETTRALIAQLPMTVTMSELNGREKYYHLPSNLPAESTEKPATIHAGEIMCWSSNSLVLFYNTFSNAYGGYVKLGYAEDISGLVSALGTGNVQVTFALSD